MEKLKLKNSIAVAASIVFCVVVFFLFLYHKDQYIYQSHLPQMIGLVQVDIKEKSTTESRAIGEWYICETFDLTRENVSSFLAGEKRNKLYLTDSLWIRKEWEKLPVDSQYNEIKTMIINYISTREIKERINEMKQIISSCSGYYSFLCQPTIENPQKIIFCLLDEKTNKLYVVDCKL